MKRLWGWFRKFMTNTVSDGLTPDEERARYDEGDSGMGTSYGGAG